MIQWFKQLWCMHYYIKEDLWNQYGTRVGLVNWKCTRCDKKIIKDISWEPLNDIIYR